MRKTVIGSHSTKWSAKRPVTAGRAALEVSNRITPETVWAIAETGYSDTAASIPRNYVAPNGKTVSTAGTGADWLTRAYDDMAAAGGVALAYFSVAGTVNNEPSDWTWPITSNQTLRAVCAVASEAGVEVVMSK